MNRGSAIEVYQGVLRILAEAGNVEPYPGQKSGVEKAIDFVEQRMRLAECTHVRCLMCQPEE